SFVVPEFIDLLRKHKVTVVCADHATYPAIADVTGDFVYARLQTGSDDNPDCYTQQGLDAWAGRVKAWAGGSEPSDLQHAAPAQAAEKKPR
ncbi:DUF72 domain-containing protein, partial [Rhizobiaceae sp. 2RAB30]